MGETFHIVSDGSCDLPSELAQEKNITVVPFYVSFDDVHYLKEKEENRCAVRGSCRQNSNGAAGRPEEGGTAPNFETGGILG